jgi:ADP-ribosylglycohydrolase
VAVKNAIEELKDFGRHEECTGKLKQALKLAEGDLPDVDAIKNLGEGWVGEEALAIAVYCSLKHRENFSKALIASVNHSGDSDSTGAVTGNIVGAYLGMRNFPAEWLEKIELKEVIIKMADDLLMGCQGSDEGKNKYGKET